jgi:hypothetical protein
VGSVAATTRKPTSPEEVEKLKEVLADAAVSALDAGLEVAKLLYAFSIVLWPEKVEVSLRLPIAEKFQVDLRDYWDFTLYNIAYANEKYFGIKAKPLCQLAGLSNRVCDEEINVPIRDQMMRKRVRKLLNNIYEMKRIGLLDKLVEVLDKAVEKVKRGEYTYSDLGWAKVDIPVGGDGKSYKVTVYLGSESKSKEVVVKRLRHVRDFFKWLNELTEQLSRVAKKLEEVGVVDVLANRILRMAGEVVDSMARELGRDRLEELVKEAVERKVDKLLSHQPVKNPSHLKHLAKNAMTYRYGDYAVFLPYEEVKLIFYEPSPDTELPEVELPSINSLADFAVKRAKPDHEAPISFEKQLPVLHDDVSGEWVAADLTIGDSVVAEAFFLFGDSEHETETRVGLYASGLIVLGLAESIKPGTTREVLQKVREVLRKKLREGVRDLIVAELFYSAVREQSICESPGG